MDADTAAAAVSEPGSLGGKPVRLLLLAALLAACAFLVLPGTAAAVTCPNSNPIINENNCNGAGDSSYNVTNYSDNIGGFTTQTSYNLGQSVDLKIGVQNPKSGGDSLSVQVYRIGYYGGAGARLISTASVTSNNSFTCNAMNATTGELSCSNWNVTYTIPSSRLTLSGIYEAKITDNSQGGIQNYVVFPVRDDSSHSGMLYVLPDATYEAYNTFGCKSLYFDACGGANTVAGDGRAVAVSFDRPLVHGDANRNDFLNGPDLNMVQWLEQEGYDVTYTDDIQTDANPNVLLQHKVLVVSGHSEYWSAASFNAFKAARDAGVNIASFSGNTAYWQTRYADNYRTLVCYKTIQGPGTPNDPASEPNGPSGPFNPSLATTTRRDPGAPAGTAGAPPEGRIGPNQPENTLWGTMYVGDNEDTEFPLTIPASDGNGQFAGNRLWRNSGISTTTKTSISTGQGNDIVGWEWDGVPSATSAVYAPYAKVEPVGVKQLTLTDVTNSGDSFIQDAGNVRASTPPPGQPSTVSSTEYRASSGAVVFSAGVNNWALGLGDPRMAQATYNVFADMGLLAGTPDGVTAASGPAPPWAAVTLSPNPVHYGNSVSFDATGSTAGSGASIVDYQFDFGNGTFVDNGSSPTATHSYPTEGTFTVRLKVTDSVGQTDVTSRTLTVAGDPPPTASFTVSPAKPVVGQTVALDASGSTAPVNPIVDYKWDLDGSGNYATDTGSNPKTTTSFATTGSHTIGLKVTDSRGATDVTTVAVTVVATGGSSYPDAIHATPGLLHYYRLGESAGPAIADGAGSANGSITGGTFGVQGAIAGDPNTAIAFNGSSDAGTVPMDLSGSSVITVEFWLKWDAYSNNDALAMEFTNNFNNNVGGFLVDPNSTFGQFAVSMGSGASRNIAIFPRPSAGVWHYYAFVLDTTAPGATAITPYVDGQAVAYTKGGYTGTGAGNFANSTLYLMSRGASSLFGQGSLDEVAVYNGALNLTRIQDHYNSYGTNPRPVASLKITPSPVKPGQTVTFDASGSHYSNGSIIKYEWDTNGDGTYDQTTTTPTITTSYSTTQTVNVGLRVTDSDLGTDYTTQSLLVGNAPPVVSLSADHNPGIAGQLVHLDASGSFVPNGSVTDYKWDLDGSGQFATDTGTTPTTTHNFTLPGIYTVSVQVTSDAGLTTTKSISLKILDQGVGDYSDTVMRTPGIMHFYKLGENAGPTVADSVGSAPGTITGGTFGVAGGVQNDPSTAISFNGTSDSGSIPMDLSSASAITVEFWMKWNAYANNDALAMEFTNNFNTNQGGFLVDPNSSYGQFAVSIGTDGASRNVALFPRPSVGVWHHYAFILDTTQPGATTITPFVDGQAVTYTNAGLSGTGAGKFANSTLYLMSRGGSSLFGAGSLQDLAIYKGDLSSNQILDHYSANGTNVPPTAAFTAPAQVPVGQQVTLDASTSSDADGQIVDYQWDLDGSGNFATDTGTNPKLTTSFSTAGTRTIRLRVIDNGYASDVATKTLIVGDTPPIAAFTGPTQALVNQSVTFDGSTSSDQYGQITDYKWDLDGSGNFATDTGTKATVSNTYTATGTYNVGLRVTNDQGQTSTVTRAITIRPATYANAVQTTPGLLAYWRLGDPAGSSTLADSSGNGQTATNSGATLGVPGAVYQDSDTAARFNGTSSFATAPLNLTAYPTITVEFWLKWNSYANDDSLAMEFTADSNNNAGGFLVDPNSSFGQFAVAIGSGASRNLALFTRPSAGVWHHYAFVLDTTQAGATEITPYVDGQAVNYTKAGVSGTGAGVFANSTLYLMSRAGTTLFGTGDLDEVALYNQALSSSTISNHYLDGAAPAATTATSLSGPATSSVGNAIPASAVSASLSGAATGASGTMTFKVFGPQSSAPTTCSSGGTTVGTPVTVTGNGTYNPGSTFTPTAAGTYWWYASYSGDSANNPSASSCGSGMASTVVGATATTTSASGPASSNAGTAIGASAISATLSGAAGNAGGTITFKVFGPQASAPTTCSTGGTTVGSAVTVSGNGNYNPSAGYTPTAVGTYWWYASYSGDANNNASTSACGSNMSSTVVSTATPTVGASGPASGTAGTSIAASALSANLSGAAAGAGGTVTFKVFGPQASAPTTCTTGGTAIGSAVTVSGNGTYHPTAGFTPATSGTYWWYASYTGDANNQAATSACGSGMTQTTVAGVTTTTSAAAPATGSTNAAIATSAVSGTLSGALSGAGGTMTFKVFGPQATAPSTCSSGGTTVGTAVTVTGNGTYHPNATFTPTTGGNYWWYASYSGDASNQGSSSACGSAMQETIVYDVTSLANATTTTFGSTSAATQQTFTIAPNTTYLLAIYRQSGSSDSVTSITSSGFTPALSLSSFTLAASQNYNTSSYQWAYYLTTGASASGSGRLTVNFARSLGSGQVTIVDLLRLQGNSLSNPFVSASTSKTTGNGSTATANLLAAPGAQDAGIVTVTAPTDLGTPAPNGSPAMTRQFYSHQFQGTLEILSLVPAKQNESFGLGTFTSWGTFALEVAHG